MPYNQVKRRVIFKGPDQSQEPIVVKPRNVIVQWTAPQVQIKREFKYLGVIRANPGDYVNRYRNVLKVSRELPEFVKEIPPPHGVKLASEQPYNPVYELEGDVEALKLVDLDREGLSEYKPQVIRKLAQSASSSIVPDLAYSQVRSAPLAQSATQSAIPSNLAANPADTSIFSSGGAFNYCDPSDLAFQTQSNLI